MKRKADGDLSNNPRTVKSRKRTEALRADPIADGYEKAKNSDTAARTYAKKKLRATVTFASLSAEEQAQALADAAEQAMHIR